MPRHIKRQTVSPFVKRNEINACIYKAFGDSGKLFLVLITDIIFNNINFRLFKVTVAIQQRINRGAEMPGIIVVA